MISFTPQYPHPTHVINTAFSLTPASRSTGLVMFDLDMKG